MTWRSEVLTALRTRLTTVSGINAWLLTVANRESPTKPGFSTSYIEEMGLTSSSDDAALGEAVRWREIVGTWTLMLCVPVDSDIFPVMAFADTAELTFLQAPSMKLADGITPIRVSTVLTGQPREARPSDPWVRVPVVFKFTVLTHT